MNNITDEIQKHFAGGDPNHAYILESVGDKFPAWVIRTDSEYGVAIPYEGEKINENFANAYFYSDFRSIGDNKQTYLFLTCPFESLRNEFAQVCSNFVDPGEEGKNRLEILILPLSWWLRWRNLIGNAIVEKMPYAVLGELMVYEYLKKYGTSPKWIGASSASHDIEDSNEEYEVKSSTERYAKIIQIHGQFQLSKPGHSLWLFYCRFEHDDNGNSIDDVIDRLIKAGDSSDYLNAQLNKLGYKQGNSARRMKYKCLEMLQYKVDDTFPAITPSSFKDGVLPKGVSKIAYDVNLDVLTPKVIKIVNNSDF